MDRGNDTDLPVTGIAGRLPALGGRSTEEVIVLALCALGIVGVTPFLVLRLVFGDILLATIDSLALLGVAAIAVRVWLTRRVHPYNVILSIFYFLILITGVYLTRSPGMGVPHIDCSIFSAEPADGPRFRLHRNYCVATAHPPKSGTR